MFTNSNLSSKFMEHIGNERKYGYTKFSNKLLWTKICELWYTVHCQHHWVPVPNYMYDNMSNWLLLATCCYVNMKNVFMNNTDHCNLHIAMPSNCRKHSYFTWDKLNAVVTFHSFMETKVNVSITIRHVTVDNVLCHCDKV